MSVSIHQQIVGMLNNGIVVLEKNGCIVCWNAWLEALTSIKEEDIKGLPLLDVLPELQKTRIERGINKALKFNSPSVFSAKLIDASFPLYKENITGQREPERLVQSIQIKPFLVEDNNQHCVISIYDISSSDLREKALRSQSATLNRLVTRLQDKDYELKTLFQNTQNSVIIFEQSGQIVNANPAALKAVGYSKPEILKSSIFNIIENLSEANFSHESTIETISACLPMKGEEIEMKAVISDGGTIPISVSANVIPYEDKPTRFFIFFKDISEKKKAEEKLVKLARFDSLTKLHNRYAFNEIMDRMIQQHHRTDEQLSIFFIDVDRFKSINDTYGHEVGDQVLGKVAERLSFCCRASDVVARWAGDEFVMLLSQQDQQRSAITVAEKIIQNVQKPFSVGNKEISVSCSIGISKFPEDGNDPDTLISKADQAMYESKLEGSGVFRFFTPTMNEQMQKRLRVEKELRSAIKKHQFIVHYQPQINVLTGEAIGVEALVRWQHPTDGLIYPDEFIGIAEECGLISDIGDWVLKTALEMSAAWYKREGSPIKMSINLSPKQFSDESLVSKLKQILNSVGVPPESVILEITESHLMGKTNNSLVTLNALKALGVKIAIDDFGTGYSSLAYLRTLPVDIIKIDREFLIDASENKTSAHIVSAIIELSHALQLDVVAEGVEQISQLELLKTEGCDQAQGFFLGKPMDYNALRSWYKNHNEESKHLH